MPWGCLTVLCLLVISTYSFHTLQDGEIVFYKDEDKASPWNVQISDGIVYIEARVSDWKLVSCNLYADSNKIKNLLKNPFSTFQHIGKAAIEEMVIKCTNNKSTSAEKRRGVSSDNESKFPFEPEKTGDPAGPGASGFGIFPGTKWCGLGNEAVNFDDLGEYNETDACCRTHDHCPYFIDHFETKYNFQNPYPWTLSHCDCDNKLYNCLKSVNTTASNEVGQLFFGLLNVKCFEFESGKYCQKEHWSHLFCEKTSTGERAVAKTFPQKWGDSVLG